MLILMYLRDPFRAVEISSFSSSEAVLIAYVRKLQKDKNPI